MPKKHPENQDITTEKMTQTAPELDFSTCKTIGDCVGRVSLILAFANTVHSQQCSTRKRAASLLKYSSELLDGEKSLLIAHAVFPDHCDSFFLLKKASHPKNRRLLCADDRAALRKALIDAKHEPLCWILKL